MAFPVGISLRVAVEWVKELGGSERTRALDSLMLCDPYGVAKVPATVQPLARKLHWQYVALGDSHSSVEGILVIPMWPVRPPNPNMRFAWLKDVDARIGDSWEGQKVASRLAVSWGGVYHPEHSLDLPDTAAETTPLNGTDLRTGISTSTSTHTISTEHQQLLLQDELLTRVPARAIRNIPLPSGARLVHGAHGDYYTTSGKLQYPEAFERFWKAYPKAVEKAEAFGVYLAMDPDPAEQELIVQGALRYSANPYTHADGQKHVPYPQRWLRRRRFEDEDVVVPCRTHQEISDHLEAHVPGSGGFHAEDFE